MIIDLQKVSKRYTNEWILRNVSYQFVSNKIYGISGSNGSGKSTLVKMIAGYLSPSVGTITYIKGEHKVSKDDIYKSVSLWGPHVNLINELTIKEMVNYFFKFKTLRKGLSIPAFFEILDLPLPASRRIDSLSSGQTQRIGLALSILSDTAILLLDEPSSYLDESSLAWLYQLIEEYKLDRTIIISSNEPSDLEYCEELLTISDYK